jgi:photosystem II stability/assembly factor-like uncharacterized protein
VAVQGDRAAVVGDRGAVYFIDIGSWKVHPQKAPSTVGIKSVSFDSRGQVWTAGYGGQFLHWNKKKWTAPVGATSRHFFGVAMLSAGRGLVVGKSRLFFRRGGGWTRFNGGPKATWRDVVAIGPSRAIVVGDHGKIALIRHRARTLDVRAENSGVKTDLRAVAACRGGQAAVVGARGVVLRRDGRGRWAPLPSAGGDVRSVAVRCQGGRLVGIYAAGGSTLYRWLRGKKGWQARQVPHATSINDMAWAGKGRLLMVGAKGFARLVGVK